MRDEDVRIITLGRIIGKTSVYCFVRFASFSYHPVPYCAALQLHNCRPSSSRQLALLDDRI
jgi:hypothetical protein